MKKLFTDLKVDEFKKVWDKNEKLRNEVEDYYCESEMHHISDMLKPIKKGLSDWSIGFYNRNYIKINKNKTSELYNGIKKSQKHYCLFSEENYKILEECFENEDYKRIESMLIDVFDGWTAEPDDDTLYSYFYEFYAEINIDDSYFIDEDYNLFKHEIKSFN